MNIKPFISVVTPVHNTGPYLVECIESVIRQTYPNFEYIVADNQSTDNSLDIARRYAALDDRIRVIAFETLLDQVPNYNRALGAIGSFSAYCKVVQADDWLFPECLERMVTVATANPTAGIIGAYRLHGSSVKSDGLPYPSTFMTGREICRRQLLDGLYTFGSPTTTMIRADLIRSRTPFYTEARYHEDTEICFELLQQCDFAFVHQVLTFTRTDNDSITSRALQFGIMELDRLMTVKTFGRIFLTEEEYLLCYDRAVRNYYEFLASNLLRLAPRSFWRYHTNGLATIGEKLELQRLIGFALPQALGVATHPLKAVRYLSRRLRHQ